MKRLLKCFIYSLIMVFMVSVAYSNYDLLQKHRTWNSSRKKRPTAKELEERKTNANQEDTLEDEPVSEETEQVVDIEPLKLDSTTPVLTINFAMLIALHPSMGKYSLNKQRFARYDDDDKALAKARKQVEENIASKKDELEKIANNIKETQKEISQLTIKNQSKISEIETQFSASMQGKNNAEKQTLRSQMRQEINRVYGEMYAEEMILRKKIERIEQSRNKILEDAEQPIYMNEKETTAEFERISKDVKTIIRDLLKESQAIYVINQSFSADYYFTLMKELKQNQDRMTKFEYKEKEVNLLHKTLNAKRKSKQNIDAGSITGDARVWLKKGLDEDFINYFSNRQFVLSDSQDITPLIAEKMLLSKGVDLELVKSIVKVCNNPLR